MEEFQVHHADGRRYAERGILRLVVGNVDAPMLDRDSRRVRGKTERSLLVGVDPILLHGYMDMDVVLCGGYEAAAGRQERPSRVLSHLGLGASCRSHLVWTDYSVHSRCKVSVLEVSRAVPIYVLRMTITNVKLSCMQLSQPDIIV